MARFAVSFQMQDVFNINILLIIKVKKKTLFHNYIYSEALANSIISMQGLMLLSYKEETIMEKQVPVSVL